MSFVLGCREAADTSTSEPIPNAQCPMPNAQCPIPNAQCPMPNDKFVTSPISTANKVRLSG
ncbi:hypothetical protein IQ246_01725 [aff. Roholtiella sp. LEGE 12411]|nr:hypothetical protein [aff. Roholtiella sp. LEGE 12411]